MKHCNGCGSIIRENESECFNCYYKRAPSLNINDEINRKLSLVAFMFFGVVGGIVGGAIVYLIVKV